MNVSEMAGPHEDWCIKRAHGDCCGPAECDCGQDERANAIAASLAAEREKARAPFLALADELDREGVVQLFHGPSNRNADTTARIRRAAEDR